jgi:hypothetical protein
MYLPDLIGWELEGPDHPEDVRRELRAMVGFPVDVALVPDDDDEDGPGLRGVLVAGELALAASADPVLTVVVASSEEVFTLRRSDYFAASCIPGHIQVRFDTAFAEIGRVKLDAYRCHE